MKHICLLLATIALFCCCNHQKQPVLSSAVNFFDSVPRKALARFSKSVEYEVVDIKVRTYESPDSEKIITYTHMATGMLLARVYVNPHKTPDQLAKMLTKKRDFSVSDDETTCIPCLAGYMAYVSKSEGKGAAVVAFHNSSIVQAVVAPDFPNDLTFHATGPVDSEIFIGVTLQGLIEGMCILAQGRHLDEDQDGVSAIIVRVGDINPEEELRDDYYFKAMGGYDTIEPVLEDLKECNEQSQEDIDWFNEIMSE